VLVVLVEIPLPLNDDVDRIERVVRALIAGKDKRAEAEMRPIAGLTRITNPLERMPVLAQDQSVTYARKAHPQSFAKSSPMADR
jgi:hypothetical protein